MKRKRGWERCLTGGDEDLLDERESQREELPMSSGWYQRMRWLRNRALKAGLIGIGSLADQFGPPYIRVGSRIFYRRGDVRAYALRQRIGHDSTQQAVSANR